MKKKTHEKLWTVLIPLLMLFGTLLVCSVPAYPTEFDCKAGGWTKTIQSVNGYVDYVYTEGGKTFEWHLDLPGQPSMVRDYLQITDGKYIIIYPADCHEKV